MCPSHRRPHAAQPGFSLVELMVTVAVLSVLAAIAIPMYDGYVREGHFTSMRTTMNGMRTAIEDYRLENGNYGATGNLAGIAAIDGRFKLDATNPNDSYDFTLAVVSTNSYSVWAEFNPNPAIWVRCDNRFTRCCDAETTASASVTACP